MFAVVAENGPEMVGKIPTRQLAEEIARALAYARPMWTFLIEDVDGLVIG